MHNRGAVMNAAFPRWMATDILCSRWVRDMGSEVDAMSRCPRSWKNMLASFPKAPKVSMATGMKWWVESRWEYLACFLFSASLATAPPSLIARDRCDGARVSGQDYYYYYYYYYHLWQINEAVKRSIFTYAYNLWMSTIILWKYVRILW